ncbi:MAG: hypothetical protein MUF34_01460 [Polyangiaceae bacterium]|nr:hypothetical protein [Polyangiaceae bacterium]
MVGRNGTFQTGTVPAAPMALANAGQPANGGVIATSGPKNRPATMIGIAPPSPGSVTPPPGARAAPLPLPLAEPASSQRLAAVPAVPLSTASGDVTRLNPLVIPPGGLPARAPAALRPVAPVTPPPPPNTPLPTPLPPIASPPVKPGDGRSPVGLDWDDDVKTTVYRGQPVEGPRQKSASPSQPPHPSHQANPSHPSHQAGPSNPAKPLSTPPPPSVRPPPNRVVIDHPPAPAPLPATPPPPAFASPPAGAPAFGPSAGHVVPPVARTGHAMPSMARAMANDSTQVVRASSGIKPLVIAGLALVSVIVLGSLFLVSRVFFEPRTSKLVVNVKADGRPLDKAQIFVDGQQVVCDAMPCRIADVATGARSLRATAEGYEDNTEVIEAEAKKEKPVTIELRRSARSSTGFRLRGPSSVRLFVDGREIGTLPQDVRDLSPGDHQIKLVSSNLYKPEDRTVSIVENQITDLGTAALKVARGRATFVLGKNAQSAKVTLVSDSDRRTVGSFPITVELDTSKQWTLEASKAGYEDFSQALLFDDGEAERSFTIALQEKGHSAAPTPPPPARAPSEAPTPPRPAPVAAPSDDEAPKGGSESLGFLNLNSIPPSTCIVDGKTLGPTPRSSVPVSPGSHAVVFVHPELGRKAVSVTLSAGETKSAAVRFP